MKIEGISKEGGDRLVGIGIEGGFSRGTMHTTLDIEFINEARGVCSEAVITARGDSNSMNIRFIGLSRSKTKLSKFLILPIPRISKRMVTMGGDDIVPVPLARV